MADISLRKPSLTERLARALKPKASGEKLRKKSWSGPEARKPSSVGGSSLGRRGVGSRNQYTADDNLDQVDIQTGERRDDTELLHNLAHTGSFDSLHDPIHDPSQHNSSISGNEVFAKLPDRAWNNLVAHLVLSSTATLAFSCQVLRNRLKKDAWSILNLSVNHDQKIEFLVTLDSSLPDHLLCYQCAIYHRRTKKGEEKLKAANILNPLFNCPWANEPTEIPLKSWLVPGHKLPFSFVQLTLRHERYGSQYGIPVRDLDRRWKNVNSGWSQQIRYYYHNNHLLMRSVSKSFASAGLPPSGLRHLLYSANHDYFPYFSVCSHWRDGELMNLCKCALGHIPMPRETITQQLQKGKMISRGLLHSNPIVTLCSKCRPMRRCPECPSEYLIEIKFEENRTDPNPVTRFKQAISVTRWSDLGDGSTPLSLEWAACNGRAEYDSFAHIGKRAISGTFESQSGVTMPSQRMLSLNPKNVKLGEEGHDWY
ncbi:hypothetical protein BJ875DRAFT_456522 [Amylocarpus encephaloides]|uniref:Uncharacterized protein n=1 Tax=Amylocarpus encephaloides TaxID=45428 RepID=A0A9P7YNX9_9HELO|nr:hypothetical protein BJ875DRAFT_456522 [Amylocarpus encephaloides]